MTNQPKGKQVPQAIDLEEKVLGACLIDHRALDVMFGVIANPEVFYTTKHQHIFKAIRSLYEKSEPVDLSTVIYALKTLKLLEAAGGEIELIELTQKISSGAHTEFHSRVILQKYMQREVIKLCTRSIEMAYDEKTDIFDLIDFTTAQIDKISDITSKGHTSITWREAMMQVPKHVEWLTQNDGKVTGRPTGLKALDKHFSGWQDEDLIVIGADSGMGKTALVMKHLLACAGSGDPCGMFSMEMSVKQLTIRAAATESQFHMNQLMRNGFEKESYFPSLIKVTDRLKDYPITIDDQPALTVMEMKRKARNMHRKHGIKLLVIDFIQMFSGDKEIRINIAEAARECKNIAKELKIPVIVLSQLSREVRKAQYCIPSKHHLRESAAIEDAADVIALIYRPAYYGFSEEKNEQLYQDLQLGTYGDNANACLIVAKNRNGSLGNVPMHYVENKTKYVDPGEAFEIPNVDPTDEPF